MLVFTLIAVLFSSFIYAQDTGDWDYYNKPIRSITFKGLSTVKASEVDGITGNFIGKTFTDELFADLVDRIYAIDLFDDISPQALKGDDKGNTVAIVFTVKERPIISRIVITGNRQVRNAEIKEAISIKEKDIFVQNKLLLDERAVRDLYLKKGFTNVTVLSSTKENERGIVVTFEITEGNATVVSSVQFRGNKLVSSKTLKGQLSLKEVGMFSKGAFQESGLEQDKQKITAYYKDRGYIDASVIDVLKDITPNDAKHRDEMTITFVVQEGVQYTFSGIEFSGNTIFPSKQLNSLVRIKEGAVFNQTKFQESLMSVADLYYENGYTSNGFVPEENKNADKRTVSYSVQIIENPRSHVEKILLKGNKKTKDYVILRELPLEPGDIFSKAKVQTGLRNLYNLQYFSAVVPDIMPGSEDNLVDLVLSLEEQSTTSIEFGLTFSGVSDPDELPFALFVKWQDSNVGGTGKVVSASTTVATTQQSLGLGYGESWFLGHPISFSLNADLTHSKITALRNYVDKYGYNDTDDYYMQYEQWRLGFGASLGHRWTPDFAILSLSGGINTWLKTNIYDEDVWTPLDTNVTDYENEWGIQNSLWTAFSVDDRDINYDPSKGWFASQRFSWYGLLPVEKEYFLRTDTKLEAYLTLLNIPFTEHWALRFILAGYTGLSFLFPYRDTNLGDNSKLYIDGMFNGRGWTSLSSKKKGRGRFLWDSYLELRFPIVPGILAVDFFGDAAVVNHKKEVTQGKNVKAYYDDAPYDLFNRVTIEDFYFSWGPSIRFCIPQFPLRLLFANTFQIIDGTVEYEDRWKFVLSFNLVNK